MSSQLMTNCQFHKQQKNWTVLRTTKNSDQNMNLGMCKNIRSFSSWPDTCVNCFSGEWRPLRDHPPWVVIFWKKVCFLKETKKRAADWRNIFEHECWMGLLIGAVSHLHLRQAGIYVIWEIVISSLRATHHVKVILEEVTDKSSVPRVVRSRGRAGKREIIKFNTRVLARVQVASYERWLTLMWSSERPTQKENRRNKAVFYFWQRHTTEKPLIWGHIPSSCNPSN